MNDTPAKLLQILAPLLTPLTVPGPVLDVACGNGRNGVFLATKGLPVICCDISRAGLRHARDAARKSNANIRLWWTNLETDNRTALPPNTFGAVMVFRYLHRPLIPEIRSAIRPGGFVIYETFTQDQARFGPPRNPDHLLRKGELADFFQDWEVLHSFEGDLS